MISGNEANSNPAWQVLSLRLTSFPIPGEPIRYEDWWLKIVGHQPDQSTVQPRVEKSLQVGALDNGNLILSIEPGRIDWIYGATANPDDPLPILGPFLGILDIFLQTMLNWLKLESLPSIDRIAFGCLLVIPVPNRKIGYEKLKTYLKDVNIDSDNSSDFLYQINKARISRLSIPDLKINRLSKWSVLATFLNFFQITPKQMSTTPMMTNHALRLEMDINTSPEIQLHDYRDRLSDILIELTDYSKEIQEKGDIP